MLSDPSTALFGALWRSRPRRYLPNAEQQLLLRAACLPDERASAAWVALRSNLDPSQLDADSHGLLALLHSNLRRLGVDVHLRPQFETIYRGTWLRNRLLFRSVEPLLARLEQHGIPTMLLKGAALVAAAHREAGQRPMADFDLLIPTAQVESALETVRAAGWGSPDPLSPTFIQTRHAAAFTNDRGQALDLHWHAFEECCAPGADDDLWQAAVPAEIQGHPTRVLAPTDQLLHLCGHAAKGGPDPLVHWAADALSVLARGPIDWERLAHQAVKRRLVLRLRETLEYLRDGLDAPIPSELLAGLTVTQVERIERWAGHQSHPLIGYLPVNWCNYIRLVEHQPRGQRLSFARYIQYIWLVNSPAGLGRETLRRGLRLLTEIGRSSRSVVR